MTKNITTLLFDFDGTLLNTNELIIHTFSTVLEKHFPNSYEREDILQFIGPSLKQTFETIAPLRTEELIKEYRELNLALHDEMVSVYDGVEETLYLLKNRGLKMAIVSTKKRDTILHGLRLMGVSKLFDTVISLDDVENPKPHPEPILKALKELSSSAAESLMIGDNSHDIEGGKNAGVRTAGVAWSAKGEDFLATFKPDYMLQHISDLLELVKEETA
ncbi:pyrophosphatase PpaX [Planomicrobium okeanokoites]|uniref:Pyrophosphatase PpaX n=1 Tax=Planomicrobium okeanokoites TaxID=244 RepID=A0ABV7KLZ3_PLAOK|nr:pyrophosphatase PpaX [Planomicrobium okeanokoites]TAA67781.1 pyrophosphatase PpaX [Planomicrobium okeanokoites]